MIPAYRKSAFGGKPGEPWPVESKCPRCGALAFCFLSAREKEFFDEWLSIRNGYHDRYLREHNLQPGPGHKPGLCNCWSFFEIVDAHPGKDGIFDREKIYLISRSQVRDVTARFRDMSNQTSRRK